MTQFYNLYQENSLLTHYNTHAYEWEQKQKDSETNSFTYLYFIINPTNNLCKIGFTKDPNRRIKDLRGESGVNLIDYTLMIGGVWEKVGAALYHESVFKKVFNPYQVRADWYLLNLVQISHVYSWFEELQHDLIIDRSNPDFNFDKHLKMIMSDNKRNEYYKELIHHD